MTTVTSGPRRTWALPALILLFAPGLLRAEEPAPQPSRPHIVLIGISEYADKQIKSRPRAEADVKALYDLFTDKDRLGVKPENVRLLLGSPDEKRGSKPATRENILKTFKWVAEEAKRDDLVIVAFVGQGGSLGARGDRICYFASDSTLKERDKTAVAAADVATEFDKLKSKSLCVLLDVNLKGFDAGKESIPEPSLGEVPYKEFLGDEGGEDHNPLPGRVIFLATNGLSASPDLEDHGIFTRAVLDALKGEADKEGYEADGVVTVDELTTHLNKRLPEMRRQLVKAPDARRTEHFIVGGLSSHFVLTRNPAAAAKSRERLKTLDAFSRQLGQESYEEGRRLLERMPRLEGLRTLRKEYQKLVDEEQTLEQFLRRRSEALEAMRLPASEANEFAAKVLRGIQVVEQEYVKEVSRGELVAHAVRGLYRRVDERIPDEINDKLNRAKEMTQLEMIQLLQEARSKLGKREDLDRHKDIDVALQRGLARLDPYTTYIDPEAVERFKIEYRGEFFGIGVQIRKDTTTDQLQVVTPIKGSPSHRIGLMAGDLITTIIREVDSDGKPLDPPEVIETKDVALNDAVKKILGKEGTRIKLTIQREGSKEPFNVTIVRGRIELESVFGVKRNQDATWDFWLDAPGKIAYVRLNNFAEKTYDDLQRTVRNLKLQGMRGLVLDLRFNPGGLLDSARQISDLFIDEGPIVSIRRPRRGLEDRMEGQSTGSELQFPMVVLVNSYSASASEIVSACLQDHARAVVVGERSYGKGSVQNIQDFDGGKIKVTIASFWRPSGKNLNKSSTAGKEDEDWGVMPDKGYLIELSRKEREDLAEHLRNSEIIPRPDKQPAKEAKTDFKDRQLDAAATYLREKARASR